MCADAVFVCASRRPQCAGDANCRRCNSITAAWRSMFGCTLKPILAAMPARTISLASPETVKKRCTPLGNESEGRFGTRNARNSSPSSRKIRACHRLPRIERFRSNN